MSWTEYDGKNPPTDTSKHRLWECDSTKATWMLSRNAGDPIWAPTYGKRWQYIEPYTTPEPNLLPCRCGGEGGMVTHDFFTEIYCNNNDCRYEVNAPTDAEAIRMWNAAMRKTEEETFNSLCDGLAKLHVKDEPDDMPDEIWVGDHNWNPEYHFKHNPHHYRKVKKCHWVWHDECENPHWDVDCDAITAPQRKHPSIDLYTHCPYCGGRIER